MGFIDRVREALTRRRRDPSSPATPPTATPQPATSRPQRPPTETLGLAGISRVSTSGPTSPRAAGRFAYTHPRFAVVDVETTGLSASSHRILEVAVVTTDPTGAVLEEWSTRLNPQGPVGATHIHGITDADVADAPTFAEVVDELNARLNGAAICAHNAPFDLAFLRAEYARAGWRMPHLPALCTLEASTHHLPDLPRRRLVDVSRALGHPPHRAHDALADAHAAAALLAAFLHPHRPPRTRDVDLPGHAHTVTWPPSGEGRPLPVLTGRGVQGARSGRSYSQQAHRVMVATAAAPPPQPLVQLLSRFSLLHALGQGAPHGTVPYLEKLAEAFEDGVLTPEEAGDLAEVAATFDLTDTDVGAAHSAFVSALALEAVADARVTRAERAELTAVADGLGIGATALSRMLKDAQTRRDHSLGANLAPLPSNWMLGEPLRVGDRVVFTGCDPEMRADLEAASTAAGVRVMNSVTQVTAVLVTDGSMAGTKATRAVELGTRTVDPATYRTLLAHLQPPSPHAAAPATSNGAGRGQADGTAPKRAAAVPTADAGVPRSDQQAAGSVAPPAAVVRAWGRANGWTVGARGRLPAGLLDAYLTAHADESPHS